MKFLQIALGAVLLALACASPSFAQLNVRDANGLVQRTCDVVDTTGWVHPCNVMEAIYGGQPIQLSAETDHSLDVTIKASPGLTAAQLTAANLALHSDMLVIENLLTPLLQGGGYIGNPNFLEDCMVVAGDQAWTAGTQQHCAMTPTGRIRVGLSSAATVGQTASTTADLAGAIDSSGNQQGLHLDGSYDLKTVDVNSAAALAAAQASKADLDAILALGNKVDTVVVGTPIDRGGSITTGGTAQSFLAANGARRGWNLQNQSSASLYVNCSATATQDNHSLLISPGQLYETQTNSVSTGACSIIGPTTGQLFYAREF